MNDLLTSFFFFFNQKTAYELRISDCSSDVCSSDLPIPGVQGLEQVAGEDASLEAELAVVHLVQRCVEVAELREDRDGSERFLAIDGRRAIDADRKSTRLNSSH